MSTTRYTLPVLAAAATATLLAFGPIAAIAQEASDPDLLQPEVLLIEEPAAEASTQAVTPEETSPDTLTAEAPAQQPPAELTATTGDITGQVTGPDHAPITGASVLITSTTVNLVLTTDANGQFSSGELEPNLYALRYSAPGYVTEFWDDAPDPFSQSYIEVEANRSATASAQLTRATTILGSVVNVDGSPAADHWVRSWSGTPAGPGNALKLVEPDGDIVFPDRAPDMYFIEVLDAMEQHLGWWDGDNTLSENPMALVADESGTPLHFHVVLGLTDPAPEDTETQPTSDEQYPTVESCTDPFTGQPIECGAVPHRPTPDKPVTEQLETSALAHTGAGDATGAVVIAVALLLVGASSHLALRLHERRMAR